MRSTTVIRMLQDVYGRNLELLTQRQKEVFRAILAVHIAFKPGRLGICDSIEAVDPDIWDCEPELAKDIEATAELPESEIEALIADMTEQLREGVYQ